MSSNIANVAPYLPTSRVFPWDEVMLPRELTKWSNDVATATNLRDIAIYDKTMIVTGQQWYSSNVQQKRQSFRKVYTFGTITAGATLVIPHGISNLVEMCRYWSEVITAVPDFRQVPYSSATVVTNQIEMKVDAINITIINGATAPVISSGKAILEFLLQT